MTMEDPEMPWPVWDEAEVEGLRRVLASGRWGWTDDADEAEQTTALEAEFAALHQARYAVAVSSGTAALTLALRAVGLRPGDEVIVPAYNCIATDMAVLEAGGVPVHADIDPETYCLAPESAEAAITERTRAVIPVHFAGQPADLDAFTAMAERYGLALIEDAAVAPGAAWRGRPVGTFGAAGCFSFSSGKPLTAGEGGMILTNDPEVAQTCRALRHYGRRETEGREEFVQISGNYRLSEVTAALARAQLARLPEQMARRAAQVRRWAEALGGIVGLTPLRCHERVTAHSYAYFVLRLEEEALGCDREAFCTAQQEAGLPFHPGWTRPNYTYALYTRSRCAVWLAERGSARPATFYETQVCPVAERACYREGVLLHHRFLERPPP
jgi:dTDP-4-amino-4,6-dideoxygalactose transaminase